MLLPYVWHDLWLVDISSQNSSGSSPRKKNRQTGGLREKEEILTRAKFGRMWTLIITFEVANGANVSFQNPKYVIPPCWPSALMSH